MKIKQRSRFIDIACAILFVVKNTSEKIPSFDLVTVLTSCLRVFILTNPQNFFTLQLAFTISDNCSGVVWRLFLEYSFSIWMRKSLMGGKGLESFRNILVRRGVSKEATRTHPFTSSEVASGWIKSPPSLKRSRMSSHWSHSSATPAISKTSAGCAAGTTGPLEFTMVEIGIDSKMAAFTNQEIYVWQDR